MLWFILTLLVIGLIAGYVARALVPGDDSMGVGATILLGVVGSFVGGFLANALFVEGDQDGFEPAGIIGSILGTILVLIVWRLVTANRRGVGRRGVL
jgi:uncharacterized membrane protein YeaQ/YmgE (transglycosylase-associated protein family)